MPCLQSTNIPVFHAINMVTLKLRKEMRLWGYGGFDGKDVPREGNDGGIEVYHTIRRRYRRTFHKSLSVIDQHIFLQLEVSHVPENLSPLL